MKNTITLIVLLSSSLFFSCSDSIMLKANKYVNISKEDKLDKAIEEAERMVRRARNELLQNSEELNRQLRVKENIGEFAVSKFSYGLSLKLNGYNPQNKKEDRYSKDDDSSK